MKVFLLFRIAVEPFLFVDVANQAVGCLVDWVVDCWSVWCCFVGAKTVI